MTMDSSPPTIYIQPFPDLPTELIHRILVHCDPPTLAQLSLASSALLQLATPVLYHSVHVRGADRIAQLLCPRGGSSPSLSTLLSLHQIHHLALSIPNDSAFSPSYRSPPSVSQARLASSLPLHLSSLTLHLPTTRWAGPSCAYDNWSTFLHWFSPRIVTLIHRSSLHSFHRRAIRPLLGGEGLGPFHIALPPTWWRSTGPRELERVEVEGFGENERDWDGDWDYIVSVGRKEARGRKVEVVFKAALGRTERKAAEMLKRAETLFKGELGGVELKVVVETVDPWDEEKVERCLGLAWSNEREARWREMIRFDKVDTPFKDLYPKPIDFIPYRPPSSRSNAVAALFHTSLCPGSNDHFTAAGLYLAVACNSPGTTAPLLYPDVSLRPNQTTFLIAVGPSLPHAWSNFSLSSSNCLGSQ